MSEREFILEKKQYAYEPCLYMDMEDTQAALKYYFQKYLNDERYAFALANAYIDAAQGIIEKYGFVETSEIIQVYINGFEEETYPVIAIQKNYLAALDLAKKLAEEEPAEYSEFYTRTCLKYAKCTMHSYNKDINDINDAYEQALNSVEGSSPQALKLKTEIYESLFEENSNLDIFEQTEYAPFLIDIYNKLIEHYEDRKNSAKVHIEYLQALIDKASEQ